VGVDLYIRVPIVIAAGFILGAVTGYALEPEVPGAWLPLAVSVATGLPLLWLAMTWVLAKLSHLVFVESLINSWPAFAAPAILAALFFPIAKLEAPFIESKAVASLYVTQTLALNLQAFIMVAAATGLLLALLILKFPLLHRGPVNAAVRHPLPALAGIVVVWIAVAGYLDIQKTMDLHGGANTAIFTEALRNVTSSQGTLYSYLLQAEGSSLLGVHASFIWYLIYPLFALWPKAEWLLIISNMALALAAFPVYFLSRRHFGIGKSLLLAILYLCSRMIVGQPALAELTEERFLPLIMFTAFYFWDARRYAPFAVFSLLTLTIREDMGLVLALFGVISIIKRRDLKWIIPPLLIGLGWFSAMMKWVIPAMNPTGETTRAKVIYSVFGSSLSEIFHNMIFSPGIWVDMVFGKLGHKLTIYYLWQSLGFGLPLMSISSLLALPPTAETLLSQNADPDHLNMPAIIACAFPALILALVGVNHRARKRGHPVFTAAFIITIIFVNVSLAYSWLNPDRYKPRYNYDACEAILKLLPDDASVVMPMYLTAKAEPGQKVFGYYQVPYEVDQKGELRVEQDFVVLDLRTGNYYSRNYDGFLQLFEEVTKSPDYSLVFDADYLQLYQRMVVLPADEQNNQAPMGR